MNETYKDIMLDVFGTTDLNSSIVRSKLLNHFNEYDTKFIELEEIYNDPDCEEIRESIKKCHNNVRKLYYSLIYHIIYEFVEKEYGHSLDFVILNYSQEEIILRLQDNLSKRGYPYNLKNDVYLMIKESAELLDERFSFDDIALINLIEASCGNNIYTEQGKSLKVESGDNKYVVKNGSGFEFKRTNKIKTSNYGKKIYVKDRRTSDDTLLLDPLGPNRQEVSNIQLESFPLGNILIQNPDSAMKKAISNLFENLELCIETYNTIYCAGDNAVDNTAYLADGTTFNFSFMINELNLPHLLGIPRPKREEVSKKSIEVLNIIKHKGYPALSINSSALDLLKFLREHKKEIISLHGLYEENGKKYEILNWEKIVLKTTSFMRGDFFKTCFCLAQIAPGKSLQGANYVSISSTEYNKGIGTRITARSVLNDLLKTVRQKRDFIFRGFETNNEGRRYIKTIMTGKSETIRVGKEKELIKTLQRYRNLFLPEAIGWEMTQNGEPTGSGGQYFGDSTRDEDELLSSIVEQVVNEKYIKTFSPEEQAQLGLLISRDLPIKPTMSFESMEVLKDVHNYNGAVTKQEIDDLEKDKGKGRKK